jgi:hypothetical protein
VQSEECIINCRLKNPGTVTAEAKSGVSIVYRGAIGEIELSQKVRRMERALLTKVNKNSIRSPCLGIWEIGQYEVIAKMQGAPKCKSCAQSPEMSVMSLVEECAVPRDAKSAVPGTSVVFDLP